VQNVLTTTKCSKQIFRAFLQAKSLLLAKTATSISNSTKIKENSGGIIRPKNPYCEQHYRQILQRLSAVLTSNASE